MAITKKQEQAIRSKAQQIMYEKAQDAKKNLTNKYLELIRYFYFESVFREDERRNSFTYEPAYYLRHYNYDISINGLNRSGLGHTYAPYYRKDMRGNSLLYTAGIRIYDNGMFNNYAGKLPQDKIHGYVINSFLQGWHGLPGEIYNGIRSGINPYDELMQYRKKLIDILSVK